MKLNWIKTVLIGLVILLNFNIFKTELASSFSSFKGKNLVSDVKMGRLWGNFNQLKEGAVEYSGWSEKDTIDLSLDPQTKGLVIYEFEKPKTANLVILQLSFYYPINGSNKISVSTDKANWQTISENQHSLSTSLDVTKHLKDSNRFWIKLEAANNNIKTASKPPIVILNDFCLFFYQREFKIPRLVLMFATTFLPILLIIRPNSKKAIKLILLFLVFSLGLHLSLQNLYDNRYHSFDNDVICLTQEVPRFLSLDVKGKLLGNYCGNKESLVMLIIIAFFKIFGLYSEMALRLSSLLFHWLTIVFIFIFGKKIKSFTTGLIAALFLSIHPYLIHLSTRGMRDSAFTFIATVFIYLLFATDLKLLRNKVMLFLTGMFSIYLRLHSLLQFISIVPIFILFKTIKKGFPLKHCSKYFNSLKQSLFVVLSLFLIALPLILSNLKTYHTWNYSEAMHLKWNTNVEFVGQPGFPSKESVALNPFQGPEISPFTYFFKLHTLPDLIISSLAGVRKTFEDLYFRDNWLGLVLFISGGWLMLKNKQLWYIPFLVFFLEIPHFFLATKNLIEYRSMTHSLPLIALTIGFAIDKIIATIRKEIKNI